MADELGIAHHVEDFTLIGRAWGYLMPGVWMLMALPNIWRVAEAVRNHRTVFGWLCGIIGIGTGAAALYLFRSVRAVCRNGTLSISQRRVPMATCSVANVARLNYRGGASATLLDHSGVVVLRFDRRMLLPSDLQRLAAKLDVPYTELTDGPSSPELLTRKPAALTER
jgi:hypothetical protein